MKLKANYHTHVKLCGHAVGMSKDYVEEAIKQGYLEIGMSDHGPISRSFMTAEEYKYHWLERQMSPEDFYNIYLPDLNKTIEEYGNDINILKGLEIEYLYDHDDYFKELRSNLDYLILGLHFFYHNNKIVNSFDDVTTANVYSYALNAREAMKTGYYNCMAHPDVYMYHYHGDNGFAVWDSECERAARLIIESAIEYNVYLEINCGGLFKVSAANEVVGSYAYPRDEFWKIASEYKGLKVVIGCDAHDPKQLSAEEINWAYDFAKKHNIKVSEFIDNFAEKDALLEF